jgi:shikimate kinase
VNIYLCGMIGSGKTTIGRRLAALLGLDFYDLDAEMDSILGYSFHKLVKEKGWLAFRELEYAICKRFSRLRKAVICLGGGTVRYEWNMDVLRGTGLIILLEAPLDELVKRVRAADRPRVNPGTTLEEDIRMIWEASREKYYSAADIIYPIDRKSIEKEVEELKEIILEHLEKLPSCPES